ncbi:MAG: 3-isopropylmalate dehydratase small subunit [Crenarchaeota archaeon]|nr:3-isopropylmalate dehydratase small subunit [Thermoproteota archaeon]MDW8034011.1 3-isopropylmalate dehydratase small subunit [Nitrososphaerota archaeon]
MLRGKVWVLGDHINTDVIIPAKYKFRTGDFSELAKHVFEDLDPTLASKISKGDSIIAGRTFGMGSSREHAPRVIKEAGISAIVACSFARIFFRNSINVGLPVIEVRDVNKYFKEGDIAIVDLEKGIVKNETTGVELNFSPYPEFIMNIMKAGGLAAYRKGIR